ncbi:MAG: hypothetical protein V4634_00295 [Pseudomonadota bacterium]
MLTMNNIASFLLIYMLCASGVQAQTDAAAPSSAPTPGKEGNSVVIRGIRHPENMAYSSFVAAQKAYEENRHYAPDAPLLFQMKTHSGKFDGLRLTIAGDNTLIQVPYDDKGRFTLPYDEAALRDDAEVSTDKKRGEIYWLPVIRSPGLAQDTLRLGDLRLYCRVKWALEKADTSVATKMMTLLRGNCDSSSFITLALPQPGMRVRLVSDNRQEIFPVAASGSHYIAHRTRWEPPFGDAAWPDDTRIDFLPPEDGFLLDDECRKTREKEAEDLYRHSYATFDPDSCVWRPN